VSVDLDDFDPFNLARGLHEWGSESVAFDILMALGPLVVLAFALGGRNAVTTALATAYVVGFVGALAWTVLNNDGT
jgi:hypothetical protein